MNFNPLKFKNFHIFLHNFENEHLLIEAVDLISQEWWLGDFTNEQILPLTGFLETSSALYKLLWDAISQPSEEVLVETNKQTSSEFILCVEYRIKYRVFNFQITLEKQSREILKFFNFTTSELNHQVEEILGIVKNVQQMKDHIRTSLSEEIEQKLETFRQEMREEISFSQSIETSTNSKFEFDWENQMNLCIERATHIMYPHTIFSESAIHELKNAFESLVEDLFRKSSAISQNQEAKEITELHLCEALALVDGVVFLPHKWRRGYVFNSQHLKKEKRLSNPQIERKYIKKIKTDLGSVKIENEKLPINLETSEELVDSEELTEVIEHHDFLEKRPLLKKEHKDSEGDPNENFLCHFLHLFQLSQYNEKRISNDGMLLLEKILTEQLELLLFYAVQCSKRMSAMHPFGDGKGLLKQINKYISHFHIRTALFLLRKTKRRLFQRKRNQKRDRERFD